MSEIGAQIIGANPVIKAPSASVKLTRAVVVPSSSSISGKAEDEKEGSGCGCERER